MADESRIESLIDRPRVSGEVKDTISEVERLVQVLQNARSLRIEVQGADKSTAELLKLSKAMDLQIKQTKEAGDAALREAQMREENTKAIQKQNAERQKEIESLKKTGTAVSELDKEQAAAANSATAWGNAQARAAKSAKEASDSIESSSTQIVEYADDLERLTGTLDQNESLMRIYKTELSQVQQELKLMDKVTSTAEKNTAKYRAKVAELTGQESRLKAEIKDLNATITQQVKINNTAAGSLDSLKARYALLTREIDRLGEAERNSAIGQGLITEAASVQGAIKKVEAETGRFQRNVGNYGNAIKDAFGKAFGFLRTAANIIPGLGISGLLLMLYKPLEQLVTGLFKVSEASEDVVKKQKTLKEVFKEAADSAAKDTTKLEAYRKKLTDLNIPASERVKVLNEYNKTADETNKVDTTQINNLQLINEKIDAQNKLILQRAVSTAALSKLTEASNKLIDQQLLLSQEIERTGLSEISVNEKAQKLLNQEISIRGKAVNSMDNFSRSQANMSLETFNNANKNIISLSKEEESVLALIRSRNAAQKELEELGRLLNPLITIPGLTTDDKSKDSIEKIRKDYFELYKFRQQLLIQEQRDIQTYSSGKARILAREREFALERELINAQAEFEKNKKDITASEILLIEEKRDEDLRKLAAKRTSDIIQFTSEERKAFEESIDAQQDALRKQQEQRVKAIADNAVKVAQAEINSREIVTNELLAKENDRYVKELKAAKGNLKEKEKAQKEHQNRVSQIIFDATVNDIQAQITAQKKLLQIIDLPEQEKEAALLKISQLEKQLSDLSVKRTEEANDKKGKSDDDYFEGLAKGLQKMLSYYDQIANIVSGAYNAAATKQKNDIEDQINLIEKQKQADIDRINATVTNRQQAADEIAIIEAKAQSRREQLELKQRQIDQRKAQWDKAASVARIGIETALAVVRALGDNTVPYPVRVAYAIGAGILGAAQLAVALATPIPRYATGTDDHPGGLAIVGDGGKHEGITLPDGSVMKSPATPTLMDLPAGTKVHPDYDKMMLNATMTGKPTFTFKTDTKQTELAVLKIGNDIVKAIKSQPQATFKADERWKRMTRTGHSFRNYLDSTL